MDRRKFVKENRLENLHNKTEDLVKQKSFTADSLVSRQSPRNFQPVRRNQRFHCVNGFDLVNDETKEGARTMTMAQIVEAGGYDMIRMRGLGGYRAQPRLIHAVGHT